MSEHSTHRRDPGAGRVARAGLAIVVGLAPLRRRRFATAVALALALALTTSAAADDGARPRLIVLALDAVPFDVVAELRAGGDEPPLLDELRGPVALISTFPSTTTVAMSGILEPFGLEPSPGYEARFFDRERNEVRGGGPISYRRIPFPWREIWDFKKHGIRQKALGGLRPIKTSVAFLEQALEAFMESDDPAFFAYTDATDLIGHLRHPDDLKTVFRALDDAFERLRARHPDEPFYTVIFSDHGQGGGGVLRNQRGPITRVLESAGFRVVDRIRGPGDVVVVPFGLISSVTFFTRPVGALEVAERVGRLPGVDLCVADGRRADVALGDVWHVAGSDGHALVRRRRGDDGAPLWRYRPVSGDPLGFAPLVERAAVTGVDRDGWLPDRWLFEETRDGRYPDAIYRLARAFELVENPASVICSLADDAMYGSFMTAAGARFTVDGGRLRHTHGALARDASLGFVMSDLPGWNPAPILRFDRALEPFAAYARGAGGPRIVTTPE